MVTIIIIMLSTITIMIGISVVILEVWVAFDAVDLLMNLVDICILYILENK